MDSSLKPHENHFVALGQLLTGAGGPADRTEQLVTGMLAQSARETRLAVSRSRLPPVLSCRYTSSGGHHMKPPSARASK